MRGACIRGCKPVTFVLWQATLPYALYAHCTLHVLSLGTVNIIVYYKKNGNIGADISIYDMKRDFNFNFAEFVFSLLNSQICLRKLLKFY